MNITSANIKQIQVLLYEICGIYLVDSKSTMIRNRIASLLKLPSLSSITSIESLLSQIRLNPQVRQAFINSLTTNKTDLFRESYHFDDMINRVLPPLLKDNLPVSIFCSASSSGEEPYSIAATCLYVKNILKSSSSIKIIATDIDTNMLDLARKGEYILDTRLNKIPIWVELDKYFDIRSKDSSGNISLSAKSSLKSMISFKQLNLFNKTYPFSSNEFNIIFCRNVLIYFKQEDQVQIMWRLLNVLKPEGTLYLGHSEDILSLNKSMDRLGNKIFIKKI